jgi:hypothetical protein
MSNKVLSTTNYSRFKFMDGNRPVNHRVKKLIKSIKRKNMLAQYPIVCTKNGDGRLYICDGQHRYTAAMELKLPIFYIETKGVTIEDVACTNSAQAKWTPRDFIQSFATLGNQDYVTLQEFIDEFGLPPSTSAALLCGSLGGGGDSSEFGIADGSFKVKDAAFARRVAAALLSLHSFPSYKDRGFVIAIARLMQTRQFQFARFTSKLEHQSTKLVKCATWIQYVEIIEDIYNWKTRADDMVPLVINVKKLLTK